jgi:hypothetical protein
MGQGHRRTPTRSSCSRSYSTKRSTHLTATNNPDGVCRARNTTHSEPCPAAPHPPPPTACLQPATHRPPLPPRRPHAGGRTDRRLVQLIVGQPRCQELAHAHTSARGHDARSSDVIDTMAAVRMAVRAHAVMPLEALTAAAERQGGGQGGGGGGGGGRAGTGDSSSGGVGRRQAFGRTAPAAV